MSLVFLDTVGLLAIWDASDQWHQAASTAFTQIVKANSRLFTTGYVFLECGNAASRKAYRPAVSRLRRELLLKQQLIEPTQRELDDAWASYVRAPVGSAGIVDLISFAVMRRLNIDSAFTNDQHFRAAGFRTLF